MALLDEHGGIALLMKLSFDALQAPLCLYILPHIINLIGFEYLQKLD